MSHPRRVPRRPRSLPPGLSGTAFTTQRALEAGVDKKRLRRPDLEHPFRGVNARVGTSSSLLGRCSAYLVRMPPGGFFCGPTAALIQGVPLPAAIEAASELHVAIPRSGRAVRRAGIVGHRLDVPPASIRTWRGLPVTAPARTWRDLAPILSTDDLIAAGDALLSGDLPLATRAELEDGVHAAAGGRGVRRLVAALPLLDGRSASRRETFLRLILIRAGITGFEPNFRVTLDRPVARYRIDIAFPEPRVGFEYQGEYHHDIEQWRSDLTRLSRLRAAGWTMVEFTSRDLRDPAELVERIRRILRRA